MTRTIRFSLCRALSATILLAALGLLPLPAKADPPGGTSGWTQVWHDEFDGNNLDTTKWNYGWTIFNSDGTGYQVDGKSGNEARFPAKNVSVSNGNLVIESDREDYEDQHYTSGAIGTYPYTSPSTAYGVPAGNAYNGYKGTYGYYEARIKAPKGDGLLPAFWMASTDYNGAGELDVMEVPGYFSDGSTTAFGTVHDSGYTTYRQGSYRLPGGATYADDYHTFAMDWEPGMVIWYVDGQEYYRTTDLVPSENEQILLSCEIGLDGNAWAGYPDNTPFPQFMYVDWVRVWKRNPGNPPPASTVPFAGQTVTLQAQANNLFVQAPNTGADPLQAVASTPYLGANSWEEFTVVDEGNGYAALRSEANGKYVQATNSGNGPLQAVASSPYIGANSWELFKLIDEGGGNYALQADVNGLYVQATDNGNGTLQAVSSSPYLGANSWELFQITAR